MKYFYLSIWDVMFVWKTRNIAKPLGDNYRSVSHNKEVIYSALIMCLGSISAAGKNTCDKKTHKQAPLNDSIFHTVLPALVLRFIELCRGYDLFDKNVPEYQ